jgi:hypothetical protein
MAWWTRTGGIIYFIFHPFDQILNGWIFFGKIIMTWICETCGREFKNTNQWHSCEQSTIEQHLDSKPEFIVEIFHKLLDVVSELGDIELLPLKTTIQVQNKVHLEFQVKEKKKFPCITKSIKISKYRVFHHAELREINEIDVNLITAIKEAYDLQ